MVHLPPDSKVCDDAISGWTMYPMPPGTTKRKDVAPQSRYRPRKDPAPSRGSVLTLCFLPDLFQPSDKFFGDLAFRQYGDV